jgi:DNA-binding NtrC family response regulator
MRLPGTRSVPTIACPVLIVDRDPVLLATLTGVLEDFGFSIIATGSVAQAVDAVRAFRPALLFCGADLAAPAWRSLPQILAERDLTVPTVILGGQIRRARLSRGVIDYLQEPIGEPELVALLEHHLGVSLAA